MYWSICARRAASASADKASRSASSLARSPLRHDERSEGVMLPIVHYFANRSSATENAYAILSSEGRELMRMLARTGALLVLSAPLAPLHAALADPQDAALVAAHAAFESRSKARIDALMPKLKGHALEPYAEYWRFFLHPPRAPPGGGGGFLAPFP